MRRIDERVLVGAAVLAILAVAVVVGRFMPTHPQWGLLAATGVLLVGVSAVVPTFLPLVAMALVIVVARVGGGGGLSVSDAVLAAAVAPALFLATRRYSPPMCNLLWLSAIYQAATLFAVVANPYLANTVDWFHSYLLVSGALVVGWAVGRQGQARLGLRLLLAAAVAIALSTILQGLVQFGSGDFSAVYTHYPFDMHKNFVGTTLAAVALIAYLRPQWTGCAGRWTTATFWLCVAAIGFTQSRQAIIALAVTLVFVVLRAGTDRRRSRLILLAVPPAVALVVITVKDQALSGNQFNSSQQRLQWFRDSITVWHSDPVFGVGLRWWYTDRFGVQFQPPNAEIEVLTTAGVIGLAGFVVLVVGTLLVLRRVESAYGTVAMAVIIDRLVQGQFDLFWVSVGVSLPFLVTGVCLGAAEHARVSRPSAGADKVPLGQGERTT